MPRAVVNLQNYSRMRRPLIRKRPGKPEAFAIGFETEKAALFRGHDCLHFFLIDVEIGGDALDVVMLLERFD